MTRLIAAASATALLFAAIAAPAQAQNTPNYMKQGGSEWHIGGKLVIDPGGTIVQNGSNVAQAAGETALGGSNPTAVATGLSSITACVAVIKESTAPGVGTTTITYVTSSGTLNLYGWKPTSNANPTLVASTGTETIGWSCFGKN